MRTVEHETPGHATASWRPRFLQSEDTTLATLAAWTVGLAIFTLAGFYFGTIAGHDNHPGEGLRHADLNPAQLGLEHPMLFQGAVPYAVGGLLCGLVFALWISFGYVPAKLKELDHEGVAH